eukprot:CAMPEP_0197653128 /NCGR_PEP_ID=MMETSP1338-20131121/34867_1 /TAXON_ID=43686 ORGANISM="Pelagodinium beii, Strain RCC1491" /NCGR_SAMPLE_ID=MMETSP1338 /ASSEMBLY_ACC=CAM_ASM_000754 /LENGTH=220 /DNA_ID=CAMNT_0043228147 /DNA_START=51 /DNA_END=713 /DNA_ORIENTATION=-
MGRQLRGTVAAASAAACCAAAGVLAVQAFVAGPALRSNALRATPSQPQLQMAQASAASETGASVVVGTWAVAAALAAVQRRTRCSMRAEQKEVEKKEEASEEKKPFDVWEPDTYGNITMDDVKKYGAAGTLSYVITELLFWAVAFPTECFAFLNTAGHWPDFSKPEDSAAVFGLVFAASNIARLLLPLRFGAALAMAPWVDENIMKRFGGGDKKEASEGA